MNESARGRYCLDRRGDALVASHLERIAAALLRTRIPARAFVLGGSFGRGEGCVEIGGKQPPLPLNDYDIAILTDKPLPLRRRRVLKKLAGRLAADLGIWHIDFIPLSAGELSGGAVKMLLYDLKCASHVFWGERSALALIPYDEGALLPTCEARSLLLNRMVTLAEGHPAIDAGLSAPAKARQTAKMIYAVLASILIRHEVYTSRYLEREEVFAKLPMKSSGAEDLIPLLPWSRRVWTFCQTNEDIAPTALSENWTAAKRLFLEELFLCSGLIDGSAATQAADLFPRWRSHDPAEALPLQRFIKRTAAWAAGKVEKRTAEMRLLALIEAYPDARSYSALGLNIPGLQSGWCELGAKLIKDWYQSIA